MDWNIDLQSANISNFITYYCLAYLQLLEQEAEMTEIEQKLQKLEAKIDAKGGPLSKREHMPNLNKTGLVVLSLVIIGSILLLSNQVNSQDRERWGIGLLGFGAGITQARPQLSRWRRGRGSL